MPWKYTYFVKGTDEKFKSYDADHKKAYQNYNRIRRINSK
jgi:hypothetical protein